MRFLRFLSTVSNLELWNWFRNINIESFMFSNDPNISNIYYEIERVGYTGHSGASFGCTMRNIEFIAKHSFDAYRHRYLGINVENYQLPPVPPRNQTENPIYNSQ